MMARTSCTLTPTLTPTHPHTLTYPSPHSHTHSLTPSHLQASQALLDEEGSVRMVAMQLVKTIGLEHPDRSAEAATAPSPSPLH